MRSLALVLGSVVAISGAAEAGSIKFKDIAKKAGVDDPGTNSAAAAFADYDNDGDIDIYISVEDVADGLHNRLWENDGEGNFTDVAKERGVQNAQGLGRGISWGDYDNDGDKDLIVANMPPSGMMKRTPVPTTLYKNLLSETGEPNFEDITQKAGIIRTEIARDLEFKGLSNTSGGVEWVDFDNDGDLDILWRSADYESDHELFRNDGNDTFTRVTKEAGISLIGKLKEANSQGVSGWFDFDQDGWVDLLSPNEGGPNVLFKNNGDGTFTDITVNRKAPSGLAFLNPGNAHGACLSDFDNDGDIDVYLPHSDQANRMIRNDLKEGLPSTFTDITLASGAGDVGGARGCTVADFDNDGYEDIYISNGGLADTLINDVMEGFPPFVQFYIAWEPAKNTLLRNNGDFTFEDVTRRSGAEGESIGKGVASGDINNDGFPDIFSTNQTYYSARERVNIEQSNFLFLNRGNSNNWIKIKLVGTESNRSAFNARVIVTADDLVQTKEIYSATGYNSQNDQTLIFGLGKRDEVDKIEIVWPSGQTQTLDGLAIKETHVITEPSESSS